MPQYEPGTFKKGDIVYLVKPGFRVADKPRITKQVVVSSGPSWLKLNGSNLSYSVKTGLEKTEYTQYAGTVYPVLEGYVASMHEQSVRNAVIGYFSPYHVWGTLSPAQLRDIAYIVGLELPEAPQEVNVEDCTHCT